MIHQASQHESPGPFPDHNLALAALLCRLSALDGRSRVLEAALEDLGGKAPSPVSIQRELSLVRRERQEILRDLLAVQEPNVWTRDPLHPREGFCLVPGSHEPPTIRHAPWRLVCRAPASLSPEAVDLACSEMIQGLRVRADNVLGTIGTAAVCLWALPLMLATIFPVPKALPLKAEPTAGEVLSFWGHNLAIFGMTALEGLFPLLGYVALTAAAVALLRLVFYFLLIFLRPDRELARAADEHPLLVPPRAPDRMTGSDADRPQPAHREERSCP